MVDIHCHILPGVDDGASSMDEALRMAEQAVKSGVSVICVTPHTNLTGWFQNYESPDLLNRFENFQRILESERIPLKLFRGAEIFTDANLIQILQNGQAPTMNASRQCLIEFDFEESLEYMEQAVKDCTQAGFRPILAHPERYYALQEDPRRLYDWVRMGALTQVNKGSILGDFGLECERCADLWLDAGLVTCVASDAHDIYDRDTDFRMIAEYLTREYGYERSQQLLRLNPAKMIGIVY